ncbi:MAG TPA: hypothetical protein DSN98_09030 [Thermoplasmata archaeon]|jgi:hypothetical protein|nr:MAG TPA: hypothetical protein DSN98_09030 [Thermoplasmata archaeon]
MDSPGLKLSPSTFEEMSQPLALDLIAVFSMMKEDIQKVLQKAEKEEWSAERTIKEITDLI